MTDHPATTRGSVKFFREAEGWGVIESPDVPAEIWVHFSHINVDGYYSLNEGEDVDFRFEHFPSGQDGYVYRATWVKPVR